MFAIKMTGCEKTGLSIWAGKRDITYFVSDDNDFVLRGTSPTSKHPFGVAQNSRRIFGSTDEIRRSLAQVSKETIWVNNGFVKTLGSGKNLGKFSNYEVHNLVSGVIHPLDDVMNKVI
jgi:hypothetical protein